MINLAITIGILLLIDLLILFFSCGDQEKNHLKREKMFKSNKEYYDNNPSKKQSLKFIVYSFIAVVACFVGLALLK